MILVALLMPSMRRYITLPSLRMEMSVPSTSVAVVAFETTPSVMAYTLPSLPNLNPYLQVLPPLPAKPMSKVGWFVGQVNSNAPPPSAKAGVTAYAPDAAASCVRVSIKPFLNTSSPCPIHRVIVLSGEEGTLVLIIHLRFKPCHRESVGDVYVASDALSSPQKVKPLSGIGLPFSRPMTSRREADEGV